MDNKEKFKSILTKAAAGTNREEGINRLLEWMESTDFFTAPASTKYHLSVEGGLCTHSLNVYERLKAKSQNYDLGSPLSIAICGLLHDLCKANYYKKTFRNVKNDITGQWEKVPTYTVEELFPYGHGEKSVFLIERFIKLKTNEAMAIRWHMGGFDSSAQNGNSSLSNAFTNYPLAVGLHLADMEATYFDEKEV